MKKFLSLLILLAAMFTISASAQTVYVSSATADTTVNQDTSFAQITVVKGAVKAAQVTVTKVSGTQHGKVVLEGSLDGNWVSTGDTLTLSDQDVNTSIFSNVGAYFRYRAKYITPSGTQQSILKFTVLRQDDR